MGVLRSEIEDVWRDERGFTLQEVLTAVVILIILVAIGVIVFLVLLERWRVNAATNQLTALRAVRVPGTAEREYGPEYYLVKLVDPYERTGPAPPAVAEDTPPEPRYFPGDVGTVNIRGALDTERGWVVEPSVPGRTRTLEFNPDGAMVFYGGSAAPPASQSTHRLRNAKPSELRFRALLTGEGAERLELART